MNSKLQYCLLLLIAISLCSYSLKTSLEVQPFKIKVIKTSESLKLQCTEGCAWNELEFLNKKDQLTYISNMGMTNAEDVEAKDADASTFLFTITATSKGVSLVGKEGTAWTDLSFSLKRHVPQTFTHMGMAKK